MTSTVRPTLTRQQILDLARAAHQAPSIHNSQPWRLRAAPDGLDVDEDLTRALHGVDPTGRERVISCGAALRNAEVAMARLGRSPLVSVLPHGVEGTHLAELRAGPPAAPTLETEDLYRAIWERRTHRRIFMATHSSDTLLAALHAAVAPFGVRLAVVPSSRRGAFAQLLWDAAQRQVHDEAVRGDLAEWTRADRSSDGIPQESQGTAPFPVDGLLTRTSPAGGTAPAWVVDDLAQGTVAVLVTRRDDRMHWIQTGRALEALLLRATVDGLVASFLNQAVQQTEFRPLLADLLGEVGHPQLVLRIGEPLVSVPPTPRRPLGDVLEG
ncbi:MAG: Acg family FMN-binding oxidoreductase [Kineosporiaceae bacterium]